MKYGWIPDLPDKRDLYCRYHAATGTRLPEAVDLRAKCPPVYDQGKLGSCTANAIGAAHQFEQIRQAKSRVSFQPSRLFIYFDEREIEGTINEDSGAMIRDGMKTVVKRGVPPETEWPYNIAKFTVRPPKVCYTHALKHQVLAYRRVDQILSQIKACLASGHPVVFGFTVYESFETKQVAKTGIVPMPNGREQVLGGHAVLAVGYMDRTCRFIVRNSWGEKWGDKGYCHMPYAYLSDGDLAADFWTMTLVEEDQSSPANNAKGRE